MDGLSEGGIFPFIAHSGQARFSRGSPVVFTVSARRVLRFFAACTLLLTAAGLAVKVLKHRFGHGWLYGLSPLLDLDTEGNLPSLYSAAMLGLAALLLLTLFRLSRAAGLAHAGGWRTLAGVFALLALDEGARLHELLSMPTHRALGTSGALYFAWVIPMGALTLGVGLSSLRLLAALPSSTRWLMVGSGALFVGGALGMEMVGGAWYERHGDVEDMTYALMTTLEELLEMSGVTLFLYALTGHLASLGQQLGLHVVAEAPAA